MTPTPANAWLPPTPENSHGRVRTVGIELEFSGINHTEATEAVARWAGRAADYESLVESAVEHDVLGKFQVEVDWRYLKQAAHEQQISETSENWVKFLRQAARLLVPVEVITPPIAATELPQLEQLIDALRATGAEGTGESPIAAYGLHINTEIPALTAEVLTPYIQSFALLQWWLMERHQVDITRRLTTYIDPYPDHYLNLVLAYRHTPTMDQLLDDYFAHNPTRNRALDLWPLFAEYAPQRVEALMHEPLIKPRPAFHYRLPNCDIDRPDWSLWNEWQSWLALERLATNHKRRQQLTEQFFTAQRPWLGVNKQRWVATVEQFMTGVH